MKIVVKSSRPNTLSGVQFEKSIIVQNFCSLKAQKYFNDECNAKHNIDKCTHGKTIKKITRGRIHATKGSRINTNKEPENPRNFF